MVGKVKITSTPPAKFDPTLEVDPIASKEMCRHAIDLLEGDDDDGAALDFTLRFLRSALKRLPSEAAIKKDRLRRKRSGK